MAEGKTAEMKEEATLEIKTLRVGDGPIRMGGQVGVTMPYDDNRVMWLKPAVYLEVQVPDGVSVEEYQKEFREFLLSFFDLVEMDNIEKGLQTARKTREIREKQKAERSYGQTVTIPPGMGNPYD